MVGTVALTTHQGLSYLAKSFYDNGIIDRVMVKHHSSRDNHYDWYPDRCNEEQLLECDTLLFLETPFDFNLVKRAKEKGIKTVIIPMYECSSHVSMFDVVINPSQLDQKFYPQGTFVPIPVTANWKLREKAQVFVHNAGNGGLGGRNGTKELIEALRYIKSPIKLIIRSQAFLPQIDDSRVELRIGTFENIWDEGDVFIFPEKFNGLSLPIQEAFASGMPVMCGDRFPMNEWLPKEMLIPVDSYKKERIAVEFDSAVIKPEDIAKTIDEWYNTDVTRFSLLGKEWGENNSWKKLKETYATLLSA